MHVVSALTQTCEACPSQWSGAVGSMAEKNYRTLYIRYRWGVLSVRMGELNVVNSDAVSGEEVLRIRVGSMFDGWMSKKTLQLLTVELLDFSQLTRV